MLLLPRLAGAIANAGQDLSITTPASAPSMAMATLVSNGESMRQVAQKHGLLLQDLLYRELTVLAMQLAAEAIARAWGKHKVRHLSAVRALYGTII